MHYFAGLNTALATAIIVSTLVGLGILPDPETSGVARLIYVALGALSFYTGMILYVLWEERKRI